jgi:hypothetical protein
MQTMRKLVLAGCAAGAAFAAATVVLAARDHAPAEPKAPRTALHARPVSDAAKKAFAVFRTASTPDASVPELMGPTAVRLRVGSLPGSRSVWASASGDQLCVYYMPDGAVGPGGGCGDVKTAATRGTFTSTEYGDATDVAGLVPDGVESVRLEGEDGHVQQVKVVDNAYAVRISSVPKSISFERPDGGVQQILAP